VGRRGEEASLVSRDLFARGCQRGLGEIKVDSELGHVGGCVCHGWSVYGVCAIGRVWPTERLSEAQIWSVTPRLQIPWQTLTLSVPL
jgi:hypothetical protein